MQEKKRKKKKSTAEQEEQTKKIQSVAETASDSKRTAERIGRITIQIESNCFRLRRYKGETANGLDFGRSCNLCCPVGCHAADAAASIFGQLDRSQHDVRQHLARG